MSYRILLFLSLFGSINLCAQSKAEIAAGKAREAIRIMDEGQIEESIVLLKEAEKLDPDNFDYPYEIALANYLKKDYPEAISILEKNKRHKNANDQLYQLLGNAYDMNGDSAKAMKIYDAGLKVFPSAGNLYLEKGNMFWFKNDYSTALSLYEKGIEVNPTYPSNYYRAAKILLNSTEPLYGLIYGEIFMNLERKSKRNNEMSSLLFEGYKKGVNFMGDSASIKLCNIVITTDALTTDGTFKPPFCLAFGQSFTIAIIGIQQLNLQSLNIIRQRFLTNYYKNDYNKSHPNVLFDFQKLMLDKGFLEAYNNWIFLSGDESAGQDWISKNQTQWSSFVEWFIENPIRIDRSNRYQR